MVSAHAITDSNALFSLITCPVASVECTVVAFVWLDSMQASPPTVDHIISSDLYVFPMHNYFAVKIILTVTMQPLFVHYCVGVGGGGSTKT